MASPFDGLSSVFVGVFGQPVTVVRKGDMPKEITAIFRTHSTDEFGVVTPDPVMDAKTLDCDGLSDGDEVRADGALYEVRVATPDAYGMTRVELERING